MEVLGLAGNTRTYAPRYRRREDITRVARCEAFHLHADFLRDYSPLFALGDTAPQTARFSSGTAGPSKFKEGRRKTRDPC